MSLLLLFRTNFGASAPATPVLPDQVVWVVVGFEPVSLISEENPTQLIAGFEPNNIVAEYSKSDIIVRTF